MALELRQQLKLTQQLIMTPQLQMAIKLLQLSRLEPGPGGSTGRHPRRAIDRTNGGCNRRKP
jgi:hypothetical protein